MTNDFEKLISILSYLNIKLRDPTFDNHFVDRVIIQKIAFISKSLGIKLNYNFNLYKKGPYCPELTNEYYENPNAIINLETTANLSKEEKQVLDKIKNVIFSHALYRAHKIDLLQAISTILFFIEDTSRISEDDLIFKTKMEKPYLTDRIIRIALNLVRKLKESFSI